MKSTKELTKILKNSNTLNDFIEGNLNDIKNITFTEYLNHCLSAKSANRSQIIDGANIQKNYGYQIFDGSKKPSRDKVLALAFSLKLGIEETDKLLILSDHSILYPRISRDSIIMFSLEKHCSLIDANILLHEMGEKIIE